MNALQSAKSRILIPLLVRGVKAKPYECEGMAGLMFAECPTGHDGHGGSELRVYSDRSPEFVCNICRDKTPADVMQRYGVPWLDYRPLELLSFDQWEPTVSANRKPIIEGWFGERDVVNLFASSKFGKSYFIAQQVVSIAAGIPFLGRQTYCPDGQLLVLDYELHPDTIKDRINQVIDEMRAPQSVKQRIVYHPMRGRDFRRIDAVCDWLQSIEAGKFGLVAFDSLYRSLPVGMSENDNREFTEIYNLLAITADAHGCAFMLPGHTSKGDQSKRKSIDAGSGAGAQGRACDTQIVLRQHPRVSGLAQMTVDVRSYKASPPVSLRFDWPLWSVVEEDDFREPKPEPFTTADLLAYVPSEPVKRDDFVRQVFTANKTRIKKVDVELLLADAINKGLITFIAGKGSVPNKIKRGKQ